MYRYQKHKIRLRKHREKKRRAEKRARARRSPEDSSGFYTPSPKPKKAKTPSKGLQYLDNFDFEDAEEEEDEGEEQTARYLVSPNTTNNIPRLQSYPYPSEIEARVAAAVTTIKEEHGSNNSSASKINVDSCSSSSNSNQATDAQSIKHKYSDVLSTSVSGGRTATSDSTKKKKMVKRADSDVKSSLRKNRVAAVILRNEDGTFETVKGVLVDGKIRKSKFGSGAVKLWLCDNKAPFQVLVYKNYEAHLIDHVPLWSILHVYEELRFNGCAKNPITTGSVSPTEDKLVEEKADNFDYTEFESKK